MKAVVELVEDPPGLHGVERAQDVLADRRFAQLAERPPPQARTRRLGQLSQAAEALVPRVAQQGNLAASDGVLRTLAMRCGPTFEVVRRPFDLFAAVVDRGRHRPEQRAE